MVCYLLSAITIVGGLCVARLKIVGYYIYLVNNNLWIVWCIWRGLYGQIPVWIFCNVVSILGIYTWRKRGIK